MTASRNLARHPIDVVKVQYFSWPQGVWIDAPLPGRIRGVCQRSKSELDSFETLRFVSALILIQRLMYKSEKYFTETQAKDFIESTRSSGKCFKPEKLIRASKLTEVYDKVRHKGRL
jgi:hypothetical protein